MNLFDIVGPVMVGPSSSHTAGAVKIGYVARKLLQEPVQRAEILLYGSFLATGKGHGTQKALVAGLMGMQPDDSRIPGSFGAGPGAGHHPDLWRRRATGRPPQLRSAPQLTGESGKTLEVVGQSIGGGRINIASIDGLCANFSGDYPTLIVHNLDQPGHVAQVTTMLFHENVNIATMQLYRSSRGSHAVMVIECDQEVPIEALQWLRHLDGIEKVTYYSLED